MSRSVRMRVEDVRTAATVRVASSSVVIQAQR
jgi:hypothetical protein